MRDFNHSINVLVKAYLNDTLEHGNCAACAVGNLIADARGYDYIEDEKGITWSNKGVNDAFEWFLGFRDIGERVRECEDTLATGYSAEELAKIEKAFELASYGNSADDWMYNGLMAVVDVLAEIHKVDLESVSRARELFVRA